MAVELIEISQSNQVGNSVLLPVHSPLIFASTVTFTGLAPSQIFVRLYDIDDVLLETYKSIPHTDLTDTTKEFVFDAGVFLKFWLGNQIEDFFQVENTFQYVSGMTKQFKIDFYDSVSGLASAKFTFDAVHAAKQFSEYPNLSDVNAEKFYFCPVSGFCYVYYYNTSEGRTLEVRKNGTLLFGTTLNEIGYHRLKVSFTDSGTINFLDDGIVDVTHRIEVIGCTDSPVLKFLNNFGQYIFYSFTKEYLETESSKAIGTVENFVTNIRTDQTDAKSIGNRASRKISFTQKVPTAHLSVLSDIYSSMLIYYKVGSGDTTADWLIVQREGGSSNVNRRKGNTGRFDLDISLPKRFTLNQL